MAVERAAWMSLFALFACDGQHGQPVGEGPARGPQALVAIDASQVQVEAGKIEAGGPGQLVLKSAGIRAIAPGTTGQIVEASFTYKGPSQDTAPLANGELRRQFGLKLRAKDTCNVVYVTWHVAPTTGIRVSVKSNPGQSTHAECGDRGYINLKPTWARDLAPIQAGDRHTLTAQIDGNVLRVKADGAAAYETTLPDEAFAFDGPIGLRSDNGEFDVELRGVLGARH